LKSRNEKLFFSPTNANLTTWGSGWAWDDYNDYYQADISAFPVYGNIVRVTPDAQNKPIISPNYFLENTIENPDNKRVIRNFDSNSFAIPSKVRPKSEQDIPFKTSTDLTLKLLSDTLHKTVQLLSIPLPETAKTIYSLPSDSVYKRMLQVSDNMLAEQLVVLCSGVNNGILNTSTGIENTINQHLSDLPDKPIWVDGSGLSRYNLFTPRSMVQLLRKIHVLMPQERLFSLLAIGGKTGTLKNLYKDGDPYIFAKSGSLSNMYNLSGYLLTKSGKTLIFSIMNNNFIKPTSEIRKEVERFLQSIHANY
jgi:D-alanyl-D-alanine carboxypeptidase/D-alanyl-D-alanine-endopeptidase (penicillin-binding protein 4)